MTIDDDAGGLGIYPREIAAAVYRRRRWLILPTLIGLAIAVTAIFLQKPLYESTAKLLINSQQIPTTIVASPFANVANERIANIREQVLSHNSLMTIVQTNNLFPEERRHLPIDDVLEMTRKSISVDLLSANEGQQGQATTIAFTLSFKYADPQKAQAVVRQLTNIFLAEDKRLRTQQASGTAAFLARQADALRGQLAELEERRRAIEGRYAGALPDQVALSVQSGAALRAEVSRIDAESQGLSQQSSLLAARAEEDTRTPPGIEALRRAEERLNQLTAIYADNYPEVIAARAAVERQRVSLRQMQASQGDSIIQREIFASHARTQMLGTRRAELISAIADLERRTALAPQATYELNMVQREYENIRRQYETLREKQLDADVAVTLQSEDRGERFSVVDQPTLPYHHIGAQPILILLAGLFAGLASGIGAIMVYDFATGTIQGADTLSRTLNTPPLGIIPVTKRPHLFDRAAGWLTPKRLVSNKDFAELSGRRGHAT